MVFINKREAIKASQKAETDKVKYKDYIEQNEAYLAKNKEKAGVTTTASGLQYEVVKMGTGPKPTAQNTVKVHYVGTLIDGTEFDSSVKRKEPATFPVSGVIPGWTEALQLMPVGSKFKLCIPSAIAYGPTGAGEVIKPYSTLIFEVELLEIVK
jgi:FKBP-type peptidyl-prolyl cis-trans isomerase